MNNGTYEQKLEREEENTRDDLDIVCLENTLLDNGGIEDIENEILVGELMSLLEPREIKVIKWRYYDRLTQIEVSQLLGVSQNMVSKIEKRALKKMKKDF